MCAAVRQGVAAPHAGTARLAERLRTARPHPVQPTPMATSDNLPHLVSDAPLAGLSCTIACGMSGLIRLTADYLEAAGARCAPHAPLRLLIDAPPTFAYRQLEQTQPPPIPTIAVTTNTCPEYIDDLWELRPAIVIVGDDVQQDVIEAVWRVSRGEQYCMSPRGARLPPGDRAVLRSVAHGWEYGEIAGQLGLAERTVRNRVSAIYRTLRLTNRSELTLYYLGLLRLRAERPGVRAAGVTDVS